MRLSGCRWGISQSSLEEVFIKVVEEDEGKEAV